MKSLKHALFPVTGEEQMNEDLMDHEQNEALRELQQQINADEHQGYGLSAQNQQTMTKQ